MVVLFDTGQPHAVMPVRPAAGFTPPISLTR
jgi:hypothetical protein